jgi:hypothetical protein
LKTGDKVRVYPHGSPEQAAPAKVAILSENERAIAVGFDNRPPFAIDTNDPLAMTVHPDHGIMLFASREALNGVPWGPWIEIFGKGHFEIEEEPVR